MYNIYTYIYIIHIYEFYFKTYLNYSNDFRKASEPESINIPVFNMKTATPRQQVFHEIVTTETNYVGILDTITKIAEVRFVNMCEPLLYSQTTFLTIRTKTLVYLKICSHQLPIHKLRFCS